MKLNLIILFCIATAVSVNGQVLSNACDDMKSHQFKSSADTLSIQAIYDGLVLNPGWPELKQLEGQRKLKASDFKYVLTFKMDGCSKIYAAPSRDTSAIALSLYKEQTAGRRLTITIITYKGIRNKGEPFFIVDKIRM